MADIENNYSELKRKAMHLLTLLYPVFYNILPRTTTLIISGALIVLDILVESLRLMFPAVNGAILRKMNGYYRDGDRNGISALLWTFTGAFLTMYLFKDPKIVTTALLYMVFGDSVAGLIGVHHGKTKIGPKKSLEGSLACFVVCLVCGLFFVPWQIAVLGALTAAIVEFLPLPFEDNFWLPVISGFALTFFSKTFS
jgi:dolichol kinase